MTEIRIVVEDEVAEKIRKEAATVAYCASRKMGFAEAAGVILTKALEDKEV